MRIKPRFMSQVLGLSCLILLAGCSSVQRPTMSFKEAALWASPSEILELRSIHEARNRALNAVKNHKVVRQFVKVSDSPDGDTPVVNLLFRNPSVLFFTDASGAKWPVTKTSIVNEDWLKCGNCSRASEYFDNSIEIYSVTPEGSAYFLVYLEGRAMPVHIMASSSSLNPVYHAVTGISVDDLRSQESAHYGPVAPAVSRMLALTPDGKPISVRGFLDE